MNLPGLTTPSDQILAAILLLGPGFVLLKTVALTGGQPQRLEWEWVVWSVLLSLPLAAVTQWLVILATDRFQMQGIDGWEPTLRFVIAVGAGILGGLLYVRARRSRWRWARRGYRALVDSAWDLVLDDTSRKTPEGGTYGLEVTVAEAGATVIYYGTLSAFGYERTKAEPWLYLTYPMRWEGEAQGYLELERTEGLLVHRDQVTRMRVIRPANELDRQRQND